MSMNVSRYKGTNTWMQAAFSVTLILFYGALALVNVTLLIAAVARH